MTDIKREILPELLATAKSYPVLTVIGPRQSGKTTLVKSAFPDKAYVSLEDPDILSIAQEDPRSFLEQYKDGVIIDEIQRLPQLLSYIQGIVDSKEVLGFYVLTGSHQLSLQSEISQSLAGRTGILNLMPFSIHELEQVGLDKTIDQQIFCGFYPRIYKYDLEPHRFYRDYVKTYLERDVKLIINIRDLEQFQRFLKLCATRVGQLIDYTQMANDLGISRHTIKEWLSILKASFIIDTLPPYFENLGKRIIKSSKLYFNDVGLACYLLGIRNVTEIAHHPLRGSLFENLVVSDLSKHYLNKGEDAQFYFYRDSNQLEVDLIIPKALELIAIEIKSTATFSSHLMKALKKFTERASKYTVSGYLVYSGQQQQTIQDFKLINYKNLKIIDV